MTKSSPQTTPHTPPLAASMVTAQAKNVAPSVTQSAPRRPTRAEAEEAVRTLIAWAGDDPNRAGLRQTPARVADAYGEYFSGYLADAALELKSAFEDPSGYKDFVLVKGIAFESHCEHHIAPFAGVAHVAYIPSGRLVGLSKLARVVEIYARRLQTQEALTSDIAAAIFANVQADGVAVMLSADHSCMSARGVRQRGTSTITTRFLGSFDREAALRDRFMSLVTTHP